MKINATFDNLKGWQCDLLAGLFEFFRIRFAISKGPEKHKLK